jgi:16S rRNA (cytidine1402-2'-O)-methyltransferase
MLYFVATPIGNLKEITFRAVEVLKTADIIYAEDTRHSRILLDEYEIDKPLRSYQKFSERAKTDEIVRELESGKNVAVISDAGMPLVCDPGAILVGVLIEKGLEYTVISGACAAVNAVILSGLSAAIFTVAGFLPEKKIDRDKLLDNLKNLESTLIFYVPPHDVLRATAYLHEKLGARKFAVVREISKKFETVTRGILGGNAEIVLKGEMVVVVEGASGQVGGGGQSIAERLENLIASGTDKKEAVRITAKEMQIPKSVVYAESLKLKKDNKL